MENICRVVNFTFINNIMSSSDKEKGRISLNYYDYRLLVNETIINYYSNIGRYIPNNFKEMELVTTFKRVSIILNFSFFVGIVSFWSSLSK